MKLPQILLRVATLATAACSVLGATVANVQADVTNLTGNITAFSDALSAFDPNSFPISAIPLGIALEGIFQALNQSTTDAQALPHPVKNPSGLIAAVTPLSTTIPNALTTLVGAKPELEASGTAGSIVTGAVGGILASFQKLIQAFIAAAVAALPAAQQASLSSVESTLDTAFTSAIGAFRAA